MDEERIGLIQGSDGLDEHNRNSRQPAKTYGTFAAFAISVNYIIGTGVFGLPYAFYSSGLLLGLVCLSVSGFFSIICINWVLEVLARTEGITKLEASSTDRTKSRPEHEITWRKFDFTQVFELYAGTPGKAIVWVAIACMCYGVLWAYGSVFSSSVASLFYQFAFNEECNVYAAGASATCRHTYIYALLVYACIVIPLALMDMGEQAVVQMSMTIYRFTAFFVMIVTLVVGLSFPRPDFHITGIDHFEAATAVNWGGFATVFLSGAVALNFHYNVPDIVNPVRNKAILNRIVSGAQMCAFSFYIILSLLAASYFGNATQPLVTLNWRTFTAQDGGWGGSLEHRPPIAVVVQLIVMLFPVFDMMSVFPLIAITLGNNIYSVMPDNVKSMLSEKKGKILSRLLAAIPPLFLAGVFGEIDKIFEIAGIFSFWPVLIWPPVLYLLSRKYCIERWGSGAESTPYTFFLSKPIFAYLTLLFGSFALIFAIIDFADPHLVEKH